MKSAPDYLLHGGKLIDGTGAPPVEAAAVLLQGGRIVFAGKESEAPACASALRIDARGLTLMPGMIDGHGGMLTRGPYAGIQALRGYLQHGVTTAITHDGFIAGKEPQGRALRDAIEQGLVRGCARLVVGYMIKCTNGHNEGRVADGPWAVRRAVREMVEAGADFIKTAATGGFWSRHGGLRSPNYTREELNALVDEAHAWGLLVAVNAHAQPGLGWAIEAGANLIYHGTLMDREARLQMAQRNAVYIPALRVTSARNIAGWPEGSEIKGKLEAVAQPHRAAVRAAIDDGVTIALGSIGPGARNGWRPGQAPLSEAQELAECGLTPLEVIQTATLRTATAYRIDQRVGSLVAGKEADILCLKGDPLAVPAVLYDQKRVAMVFQKGRLEYASAEFQPLYSMSDFE